MNLNSLSINSTCTGACPKISNSICWLRRCRCMGGFVPSADNQRCIRAKKYGESCNSNINDNCLAHELECNMETGYCQCAPGYKVNKFRTYCLPLVLIQSCTLEQLIAKDPSCNNRDYEIVVTHHRPRFSVLTFFILVVCCLIILRKNSSNSQQSASIQRRHARSNSANNQMLTSFVHTYGRRPIHESTVETELNHSHTSLDSYQENHPPPAYNEIFALPARNEAGCLSPSAPSISSKSLSISSSEQAINLNNVESTITGPIRTDSITIQMQDANEETLSSSQSSSNSAPPAESPSSSTSNEEDPKPPSYDEAIHMTSV